MLRASRTLLTLIALASVGPAIASEAGTWFEAGGPDPKRLVSGLIALIPGLLAIAAVGRLVLSLLPAGEVGSHRLRHVGTTWAASHFLGLAAIGIQLAIYRRVGLGGSPVAVFVPWALGAALRLGFLPSPPVPRRELASEEPKAADTLVLALFLAAAALPLIAWSVPAMVDRTLPRDGLFELTRNLSGTPAQHLAPISAFTWPALLLLVGHALACARRAPLGRRVLILLPALVPFALGAAGREASVTQLPLFFGAGCCFLIPWLRRADRRSACLSAIGFAACGLVSPSGLLLGLSGLLVLWFATPVPSKLIVSTAGAIAFGAVALPDLLNGSLFTFGQRVVWDLAKSLTRSPHRTGYWTLRELLGGGNDLSQWGLAWALVALVVLGYLGLRAAKRQALLVDPWQPVDPPGRELWTLLSVAGIALVLQVAVAAWVVSTGEAPWIASDDSNSALLTLLPAALLIVGLVLVRPEHPKPAPSAPAPSTAGK